MNVLHLQLSGGLGGISVLCRDINRISHHNNYFYFVFEGGCVADDIEAKGGKICVPCEAHKKLISGALHFVKYCKENNIDVVLDHTGSPVTRFYHIIAAKLLKNVKFMLYLHSNADKKYGAYDQKIKQIISEKILYSAYRNSSCAVAISQTVKDSFVKVYGFDKEKIKLVYNGIDIRKFYHSCRNDNEFRIIYVGRLIEIKGIHLLIKALALSEYKDNIKLYIVGTGPDEYIETLNDTVNEKELKDNVIFTGAQNDVTSYLAQSDIFVHPAVCEEGFGITMVEAMASSLPCVAFNKGAVPEIINPGENGIIVNEESPEALACAIDELYVIWKNGNLEPMRQNAVQTAKKFTIENTVKALEELY